MAPEGASAQSLCLAAYSALASWQAARFPMAKAPDTSVCASRAANDKPPPPPPSLHRAIWAEVELCELRLGGAQNKC